MMENCLDIGTIQAFVDGELDHGQSARVSAHAAICNACSLMLAEADDQSALVFSALDREFNTLVPTQRLWNKINDSIVTERESRPFWQKAYAFLTVALVNPSFAAAASLLIVIGIFSALWINRTPDTANITRTDLPNTQPVQQISPATLSATRDSSAVPDNESTATLAPTYRVERAAFRPEPRRIVSQPAAITASVTNSTGYMPGEESYVKTISSLAKTVEEQKDGGIMRPSERIAYERDMAVVNDSIVKMRQEVKRNPRNESAKQVLYSSYQNKIDLLNSVTQKEDLLVSLK
jgi:hypothetical protein